MQDFFFLDTGGSRLTGSFRIVCNSVQAQYIEKNGKELVNLLPSSVSKVYKYMYM